MGIKEPIKSDFNSEKIAKDILNIVLDKFNNN